MQDSFAMLNMRTDPGDHAVKRAGAGWGGSLRMYMVRLSFYAKKG